MGEALGYGCSDGVWVKRWGMGETFTAINLLSIHFSHFEDPNTREFHNVDDDLREPGQYTNPVLD